jgi:hypothetical protein
MNIVANVLQHLKDRLDWVELLVLHYLDSLESMSCFVRLFILLHLSILGYAYLFLLLLVLHTIAFVYILLVIRELPTTDDVVIESIDQTGMFTIYNKSNQIIDESTRTVMQNKSIIYHLWDNLVDICGVIFRQRDNNNGFWLRCMFIAFTIEYLSFAGIIIDIDA